MARQNVSPAQVASTHVALPELARRAQSANDRIAKHFNGRFGPALVLIGSHLRRIVAIYNAVIQVEMGSLEGPDQERRVDGFRGGRDARGIGDLVVLNRARLGTA